MKVLQIKELLVDRFEGSDAESVMGRGAFVQVLDNVAAGLAYLSVPVLLDALIWMIDYAAARSIPLEPLERFLGELEREGFAIRPAEKIKEAVSQARHALEEAPRTGPIRSRIRLEPEAQRYLKAVLAHDGGSARDQVLRLAKGDWSVRRIYLNILQPVLMEVGELWLQNRIGVADEHYCTAVTQTLMVDLHPLLLRGRREEAPSLGRALLFGVGEELHDFGVRMVADFLEIDGWDTYYLGANLPSDALSEAVESYEPQLVAISVTLPSHLAALEEMIQALRGGQGSRRNLRTMVGGYPFSIDPELARFFAVDGFAPDALHAVRVARQLSKSIHGAPSRLLVSPPSFPLEGRALSHEGRVLDPMEEITRLSGERVSLHRRLSKCKATVESLNEERDQFLGIAVHDLRNPMQTVLQCAQALQRPRLVGLREPELRLVRLIDRAASSMAGALDHFLDISMIESGKIELRSEPTDLVSLVENRIAFFQILADQAGVRISKTKPRTPVVVEVDPGRINQVLDNLLSHAMNCSPKGSEVEVEVSMHGAQAVVSIHDEGPGIPLEQQQELFQPFHRLPGAVRHRKPGTGIGLHIAKRVVQQHGGRVWLERPSENKGSVFSFSLPLTQARLNEAA